MATEIERRFLVDPNKWIPNSYSQLILQGYLSYEPVVRVRVVSEDAGVSAFLTVKGPKEGFSNPEFEYAIPHIDGVAMLRICRAGLEKRRHRVLLNGSFWDVDVFLGRYDGLIIAEIELSSEDEAFELPSWVTEEITHKHEYSNVCLAKSAGFIHLT